MSTSAERKAAGQTLRRVLAQDAVIVLAAISAAQRADRQIRGQVSLTAEE